MSRTLAAGLLLLVSLGLLAGACGGSDDGDGDSTATPSSQTPAATTDTSAETPDATAGATSSATGQDASAIEALVRAQAQANNTKDVDAFVASFSDGYYTALGVSRDDARALVGVFIGLPQVEVTRVTVINVSGDTATAEVDSNEGVIISKEKYTFVRESGQWLIQGIEELPVEARGTTMVDLKLSEYAFDFDDTQAEGDYALNVSNVGTEPHEIELMKLPAGITAAQLTDREHVPAGVETIGLFGPLDPGEHSTLVFSSDLPAGNYALVCYLTAPDGSSNAQHGMVRDLVVD